MFVVVVPYSELSSGNISECLSLLGVPHAVGAGYVEGCTHVILSGGPAHVYERHPGIPLWIFNTPVKVLGICYGMQLIVEAFGGYVHNTGENKKEIEYTIDKDLVRRPRYVNRRDIVLFIPDGFTIFEASENGVIAGIRRGRWTAVQYHPESKKCRDLTIFEDFINL